MSSSPSLFVQKLTPEARAPTRGSAHAAGYDLYSSKATVIPARGKELVSTGLAIAVPEGTCMFIPTKRFFFFLVLVPPCLRSVR